MLSRRKFLLTLRDHNFRHIGRSPPAKECSTPACCCRQRATRYVAFMILLRTSTSGIPSKLADPKNVNSMVWTKSPAKLCVQTKRKSFHDPTYWWLINKLTDLHGWRGFTIKHWGVWQPSLLPNIYHSAISNPPFRPHPKNLPCCQKASPNRRWIGAQLFFNTRTSREIQGLVYSILCKIRRQYYGSISMPV